MFEVNCGPLSDVISSGTPKRDIQPKMRALAQSSVVVELRGIASGQREVLSIIVKKYVNPAEGCSGPTKLIRMSLNRFDGTWIVLSGEWTCIWIFEVWHSMHFSPLCYLFI